MKIKGVADFLLKRMIFINYNIPVFVETLPNVVYDVGIINEVSDTSNMSVTFILEHKCLFEWLLKNSCRKVSKGESLSIF